MGKPLIWDEYNCNLVKKLYGKKTPDEIAEMINKYQVKQVGGVVPTLSIKQEKRTGKVIAAKVWPKGRDAQFMTTSGGGVIYEAIRQGLATEDDYREYKNEQARKKGDCGVKLRKTPHNKAMNADWLPLQLSTALGWQCGLKLTYRGQPASRLWPGRYKA